MTTQPHGFINPVCAAAIVTKEGDRYPLFGDVSEDLLRKVNLHAIGDVKSITVELSLGLIPKIQVEVGLPFVEARELLNSALIEHGYNSIEVQMGYLSREDGGPVLTPVFTGWLQVPEVSTGEEIGITLVGQGQMKNAVLTQNRSVFDGKTRRQIIQALAAGSNPDSPRKFELDFSLIDKLGGPNKTLLDQKVSMVQGSRTDVEFMRLLAQDCMCNLLVYSDRCVLVPIELRATRQPSKTLRLYDYPEGRLGLGEYPALSATSATKALYSRGALDLALRAIDPITKEVQEVIVSDKSNPQPRTSESKAGDVKGNSPATAGRPAPGKSSGLPMVPGGTSPLDQQRAAGVIASVTSKMVIDLEVEALGIPDVLPGDLVAFRGLGVKFDRNYEVGSLTHTFSDGAFRTSLKLKANTYDLIAEATQEVPRGQQNKQKPDPSKSGTTDKEAKPG